MSLTRLITQRFLATRARVSYQLKVGFGVGIGVGFALGTGLVSYNCKRHAHPKRKESVSHTDNIFGHVNFSRVGWPVMTDTKRQIYKQVSGCTWSPDIKFNIIDKTTLESRHANRERIALEKQSSELQSRYNIFGEDECLEYARRCALTRDYVMGVDMYHDIKLQLNQLLNTSNDYVGCWMFVSPNVKDDIVLSIDIIIADSEGDIFKGYSKLGKNLSNGYRNRIGHEVHALRFAKENKYASISPAAAQTVFCA